MKRREFIAMIGGAVSSSFVRPLVAVAQRNPMPVIGYFHFAAPEYIPTSAPFLQGLAEFGYVVDKNVAIEYSWARGEYDRLPAMAAAVVARKVDLIAAFGPPVARAAKNATSTIPIVFEVGNDAVAAGLVASLPRPGGNATGVNVLFTQITPKRLELLAELVPRAKTIGLLINPNSPTAKPTIQSTQEPAREKGIEVPVVNASTDNEMEAAFAALAGLHADALVISADPFFDTRRERLVALAALYSMPTSYFSLEAAAAGGLISYGTSLTGVYREVGRYAGRILKGDNPADLPVLQPTKFELIINLKTAKALGLAVPPTLLATADQVIE